MSEEKTTGGPPFYGKYRGIVFANTDPLMLGRIMAVVPAVYHGGVALGVAAGSRPWLKGDQLTWAVANDGAGKFQDFFRKHYRAQLPSVASGASMPMLPVSLLLMGQTTVSETIPDSLVA